VTSMFNEFDVETRQYIWTIAVGFEEYEQMTLAERQRFQSALRLVANELRVEIEAKPHDD